MKSTIKAQQTVGSGWIGFRSFWQSCRLMYVILRVQQGSSGPRTWSMLRYRSSPWAYIYTNLVYMYWTCLVRLVRLMTGLYRNITPRFCNDVSKTDHYTDPRQTMYTWQRQSVHEMTKNCVKTTKYTAILWCTWQEWPLSSRFCSHCCPAAS